MFEALFERHPNVALVAAGSVWVLALVGISLDFMFDANSNYVRILSLTIYVVQGWFVAIISPWLFPILSAKTLNYLAAGGIAYTSGIYFYIRGNRNPKYHIIWHIFVLAGASLHFISITDLLFGPDLGVYSNCSASKAIY